MLLDIPTLITPEIKPTEFFTTDGEVHDRSKTLSASAAHGCERMVAFEKHGFDPDPEHKEGLGYFERGNVIESWIVGKLTPALAKQKMNLLFAGDDQQTLVFNQLSATPDGLITNVPRDIFKKIGIPSIESTDLAAEFKSLDPRSDLNKPKQTHITQIQLQMSLFDRCTEYAPRYGILVYINASDFMDIKTHVVAYSPRIAGAMMERAERIFTTTDPMQLMAEGKLDGSCRYCKYTKRCGEAIIATFPTTENPELEDDVVDQIESLATLSTTTNADINRLKSIKHETDEQLKILMREYDVKKYSLPDYTVSYTLVRGRRTLDTKALKEEVPDLDLDNFYTQAPDSDRLSIRQSK